MTEHPAVGNNWMSDWELGCGCFGDPGARSDDGRRAPQRRAEQATPTATTFAERWRSMLAAMAEHCEPLSSCCDPFATAESGEPSTHPERGDIAKDYLAMPVDLETRTVTE